MPIGLPEFLWGAAAPVVVAGVVFVLSWKCRRNAVWAWSAGVLAGFLVGFVGLRAYTNGWTDALTRLYRPGEAVDWIPLLTLAAVIPWAAINVRSLAPVGWILALGLSSFMPSRLLDGGIYLPSKLVRESGFATDSAWTTEQAIWIPLFVAVLVVAGAAFWFCQPGNRMTWTRSLLLVAAVASAAVVVTLSGSFTYGLRLGALAAAIGGATAASWLQKVPSGPEQAALPTLMALACYLVLACSYSELQIPQALLISVAVVLAVAGLPGLNRASPAWAGVVRCLLVALPLMTVVGEAALRFAAEPAEAAQQDAESAMYDYYSSPSADGD